MLRSQILYILLATTVASSVSTAGAGASSVAMKSSQGDQITLKSGKTLNGVRIIRQSSLQLVLEVIPDIDPLIIPARQVADVSHGTTRSGIVDTPVAETIELTDEPRSLAAVKTSVELLDKMSAPCTEDTIDFPEQDILETLRTLGEMSGVAVSFSRTLEARPVAERSMSVRIEAGTSFDAFIRESLAHAAPWIGVDFRFEELQFHTRDVAETAPVDPAEMEMPGGDTAGRD